MSERCLTMNDDKLILVDCDGVCMNWEYAFHTWLTTMGYHHENDDPSKYNLHHKYVQLDENRAFELSDIFNSSAAMGFLPPLRDAMYYIDLLHRKHGYVFHMITSMSSDINAQRLRKMNTEKLFGNTAFEKYIFLDRDKPKYDSLKQYEGSGLLWIEDLPKNAIAGKKLGLDSILMEHSYNMYFNGVKKVKNWKEIYKYIIGE